MRTVSVCRSEGPFLSMSRRCPRPGVVAAARCLATAFVLLTAAMGAGLALADVTCRPGSLTPGCVTQGAAPQNPALSALACQLQPSMPGCTTQTPAPEPEPPAVTALTASFHGLPDAHDGKKLFTFELRFSREFAGLRLGMVKQTLEVTNGRLVGVKRTVRGQNRSMTVKVRPSSSGEVTVALPQVGWLWSAASAVVSGPSAPSALSALTASFHGLPNQHDGKKLFSFEIRFSEEFDGMTLTALKQALEVTGGRLIDVKRTVRGQNRSVTVRVRPSSHDPVTVTLGATTDCSAAGAICAKDGRQLSASATASIFSPAYAWGGGGGTPYSLAELKSLNPDLPVLKTVVKTVSTTKPPGFPTSETGTVVTLHNVGQVRERYGNSGAAAINFPCKADVAREGATPGTTVIVSQAEVICRIGGDIAAYPDTLEYWNPVQQERGFITGHVSTYGRWFTYPANAGTNDMKVHVQVRRATLYDKVTLARFFDDHGHNKQAFYDYYDFLKAEAHLEAPGTAVQPTIAQNSSATWTGGVVALDTAHHYDTVNKGNWWRRGDVIGGTATITVSRTTATNPEATVRVWNLKGSTVGTHYPDLTWADMTVSNGSFSMTVSSTSADLPGSKISGTFRGTGAAKVGGTFNVPPQGAGGGRYIGMVGGFVADKD